MTKRDLTTVDEILHAALAKEEDARDFYGDMAARCQADFVRDLLQRLQGEEVKHVHLIRDMLTKLNLGKDVI